jgi:predicted DCC family thiol-disulfide oxidoreductase YuxK
MQRDFDGGFDLFMIGANLFLIFMPMDKAFALDGLRKKLATPFVHYSQYQPEQVSRLAYYLPVVICLGFLYFDSDIHKMFAPHWRNGLGAWLPSSIPYYISALDMSWLLNIELLQKAIGYTIVVFQFTFLPLFYFRQLRPFFLLIFYALVAPFSWYRQIGLWLKKPQPILTVFYDQQCPLCNRTVLILNHFDVLNAVDFKPAQIHANQYPALKGMDEQVLLKDLYAVDKKGQLYAGVDTYAQILIAMGYTSLIGRIMQLPLLHSLAMLFYRRIADNRARLTCDVSCMPEVACH